jgi:hypothetical protein
MTMKPLRQLFLGALLMGCLMTAGAADAPAKSQAEPPPPLPEELEGHGNIPQPEVTIIHKQDRTVEEVRINGVLRYAKVIPKAGPPYYFIDTDGDGQLDTRRNELDNPTINQWILKQW